MSTSTRETGFSEFEPDGSLVETFGEGQISNSRGVAVDGTSGEVFAANGASVVEFEVLSRAYNPIDNPAIVDAVTQAATHTYGDFQISKDGHYAAFASVEPLTGYDNGGHLEVFRYDAQQGRSFALRAIPRMHARWGGLDSAGGRPWAYRRRIRLLRLG